MLCSAQFKTYVSQMDRNEMKECKNQFCLLKKPQHSVQNFLNADVSLLSLEEYDPRSLHEGKWNWPFLISHIFRNYSVV